MFEQTKPGIQQEAHLEFEGYQEWLKKLNPEEKNRHENYLKQHDKENSFMNLETRKGKLLAHYCQKKPEKYYQIDSFNEFDSVIGPPDANGVCCMGGENWELMNSPFVARLLIKENASKKDIIASLKSMLSWASESCDRCGCIGTCHPACENKELSDEQVKAIVAWAETYHQKNKFEADCPF